MADAKISALPAVTTPLALTEELPAVQSSTTKKVTAQQMLTGVIVTESGTTRTLSASDNGKIIYCTSGIWRVSAIQVSTGGTVYAKPMNTK